MSYDTLTSRERALIAELKEAKQQRDTFFEAVEHDRRTIESLREDIERLKTAKLQIKEILQDRKGINVRLQIRKIEETFSGLRIFVE